MTSLYRRGVCQACGHAQSSHAGACRVVVGAGPCPCGGYQGANKFGAQRCACDQGGTPHTHDSKAERARCFVLHQRQAAGEIETLLIHGPRFGLTANDEHIGYYTPDATYWENGRMVVEDVKSPATRRTEGYRLRKKLLKACHGIEIREIS